MDIWGLCLSMIWSNLIVYVLYNDYYFVLGILYMCVLFNLINIFDLVYCNFVYLYYIKS